MIVVDVMPLIDDVNGVGCVPVPWRNARVELHAHVFSAVRNYGGPFHPWAHSSALDRGTSADSLRVAQS